MIGCWTKWWIEVGAMVVGRGGPGEGGLGVGADCALPAGLGITTEGFFWRSSTIRQLVMQTHWLTKPIPPNNLFRQD